MSFRIRVKSVDGTILNFNRVESYKVKDGFVFFTDSLKEVEKLFPIGRCDIEVEK